MWPLFSEQKTNQWQTCKGFDWGYHDGLNFSIISITSYYKNFLASKILFDLVFKYEILKINFELFKC